MRTMNKIWGVILIALAMVLASPTTGTAQGRYVSQQVFYDELEPYGTWVYDPDYGNVWVPDVENGFQPYATRGYWALTSYGNTWVSDYDWGWAPFHYGRWRFDNYYGWTWVPGYDWAPAWVTWRQGGGYYGWAPLMPGLSINVSFGGYSIPNNYWVFAPQAYITSRNIYDYYVPYNDRVTIINRTTYINNVYQYNDRRYYSGPRSNEIQRATGRPVRVYNVNNVSRASERGVRDDNINVYRPSVRQVESARPSRVVDGAAYRRENPEQRIASRSEGVNRSNANRLAQVARNANSNSNVVRVNDNARPVSRVNRNNGAEFNNRQPVNIQEAGGRNTRPATDMNRGIERQQQRQQADVQRRQIEQQREQITRQRQQSQEQTNRQWQVQRDQAEQQRQQQRQQADAQRRQIEQQREQITRQRQQSQEQTNRQWQAQRDQVEQQRQQQRQQADMQRRQVQQQREQVNRQREAQRQQQRSQVDFQRQQRSGFEQRAPQVQQRSQPSERGVSRRG